jgi:hypothetical protein
MKRFVLALVLVGLVGSMVLAMDLNGKWGVGVRSSVFGFRRFMSDNFAMDVYLSQWNATQSNSVDSNYLDVSLAGLYLAEIAPRTLLEIGATLDSYQGTNSSGYFQGYGVYPSIGAEYFLSDSFGLDFKVFFLSYSSDMQGAVRYTSLDNLSGNLGAHVYF